MATKINWADETWNPITGCTKISPGCKNCYAERMAKRLKGRFGYPADDPFRVTFHFLKLDEPLKWMKPRKIFVCSMGDFYHPDVKSAWRDEIYHKVLSRPEHIFIFLTKRPENIGYTSIDYEWCVNNNWPENVWLGVTAENQEQADKRIPILLEIPAAVRFLSLEPMLSSINLIPFFVQSKAPLHLVIVGGESGPGARPMIPDWPRFIRDQCQSAGVPFFFKQWGEYAPAGMVEDETKYINKLIEGVIMCKVGKKKAGRLLDGRTWDDYPPTDRKE